MKQTGSYGEAVKVELSKKDKDELIRSLDRIRDVFGSSKKMQALAFDAAKPMAQYIKQTAPVNTDPRYIGDKIHWKGYKPGALKRSIARWKQYGGVLVGARFGKNSKTIANDGWYVHFAHDVHPVRGGKSTKKSTGFIADAVMVMGQSTINLLKNNCKRLLDGLW